MKLGFGSTKSCGGRQEKRGNLWAEERRQEEGEHVQLWFKRELKKEFVLGTGICWATFSVQADKRGCKEDE
jgi:hypothetical protein